MTAPAATSWKPTGGLFVTFEGIEGCGKSTHLRRLAAVLRTAGYDVVETREPGGTALGQALRALLLAPSSPPPAPLAELLMYCADRAQHVAHVILPALADGRIVLCDRFSDSTIAYQGYARGLDLELVQTLDARARGGLEPSLTILLDCPVADGLARAHGRGETDRFEQEALAFHVAVRDGFHTLAATAPTRYRVIDSSRPADQVARDVETAVRTVMATETGPA